MVKLSITKLQGVNLEKTIEYVLRERYNRDSSIVYDLSESDLRTLLCVVGEEEPIIDALNVLSGASIEQRARDIGCHVDDFWYESNRDGEAEGGGNVWDDPKHSQR